VIHKTALDFWLTLTVLTVNTFPFYTDIVGLTRVTETPNPILRLRGWFVKFCILENSIKTSVSFAWMKDNTTKSV